MLRRRLSQAVLLLIAVSLLSFSFAALTPESHYEDLRLSTSISPEAIEAMRARHGLDDPLPVRYGRWVFSMMRGELGHSIQFNTPVAPLVLERMRNTFLLGVASTLGAWLIAIPLGTWVAASKSRWVQALFAGSTSTLLAIPDILLALLFLILAAKTGLFPLGEMVSDDFAELSLVARALDLLHHLLLPAGVIVLGLAPALARQVHASLAEVLDRPFIQAAKARGVAGPRLLYSHALPAAANPLITLFGLSIASLLSVSLLVEVVLDWPGLGPLLRDSILNRDVDLVMASVLFSTLLLVLGNGLADIALYLVDPVSRTDGSSSP